MTVPLSDFDLVKKNFLSDLCLNKVSDIYETKFVNAAAWMISRKCLEMIGGFDPLFFHYGEDYNYCQRVQYHGLKVGIVPSSSIYHNREFKVEKYESEQIYRHYLLTLADINNSHFRKDKKRLGQQDIVRMMTSVLRGDLNRLKENYTNLRLKTKYFPDILKSREKNMAGGPVYIS